MDYSVFEKLFESSDEKPAVINRMALFEELAQSWDDPEERMKTITLAQLLDLAEHFSETVECFEDNVGLVGVFTEAVEAMKPVPRRRLL